MYTLTKICDIRVYLIDMYDICICLFVIFFTKIYRLILAQFSTRFGLLVLYLYLSFTLYVSMVALHISIICTSINLLYNFLQLNPILHSVTIFSRDPHSIVEPVKMGSAAEQNRYNSEIEKAKGTAWRHIFLIRHGQYNVNGASDKEQTLTEMGKNKMISI